MLSQQDAESRGTCPRVAVLSPSMPLARARVTSPVAPAGPFTVTVWPPLQLGKLKPAQQLIYQSAGRF